jgi:hypothetical protein
MLLAPFVLPPRFLDPLADPPLLPSVFTLIISLGHATVYVLTRLYSQPKDLGAGVYCLLIVQLIAAALIVILLNELLPRTTDSIWASCSSSRTFAEYHAESLLTRDAR